MQERDGPSEWESRDGAEAMHSAVLLAVFNRVSGQDKDAECMRILPTHLGNSHCAVMQQHLVYSVTCKYLAKMPISYEILFAPFETVHHRCLRQDQRPVLSKIIQIAWRIRQSVPFCKSWTTQALSQSSICTFWQSQAEKESPPHSKYVRFLLWEWSIYTLVHIQGCAIKLNTASVARGACATVITTLSPFSLLYHSE